MIEWRDAESGRGRWSGTPSRRPAVLPPRAEELRRIVQVAEELGLDPHVVWIALSQEDGRVETDVGLGESIRAVERALGGARAAPTVGLRS